MADADRALELQNLDIRQRKRTHVHRTTSRTTSGDQLKWRKALDGGAKDFLSCPGGPRAVLGWQCHFVLVNVSERREYDFRPNSLKLPSLFNMLITIPGESRNLG
jgi:hypothetical protein